MQTRVYFEKSIKWDKFVIKADGKRGGSKFRRRTERQLFVEVIMLLIS